MRSRIILGAQLSDLAAFLLGVSIIGIRGEANPIIVELYAIGGLGLIVASKVGGAVVLAWLGPRLGRWWILPAVAGMIGAATAIAAVQ
jgi:hypothetical protein